MTNTQHATEAVTYRCKCEGCQEEFDSSALIEIEGRPEYQGASTWQETVSPCCYEDYEEIYD